MYFNLKVNFFFLFFLSSFGVSRNFISNISVSWLKPLTEGIFPKAAINAHSRANSEVQMVIPRCHGGSVRRAVHLTAPHNNSTHRVPGLNKLSNSVRLAEGKAYK